MGTNVERRQMGGGGLMVGRGTMNASRQLSDTVNGCYENPFMSVQTSSLVLNIDVAHTQHRRASFHSVSFRGLNNLHPGAIFRRFSLFICKSTQGKN